MFDVMNVVDGHILIVDDDAITLRVVEAILQQDGYRHIDQCSIAFNVRELHRQQRYDAILLDIHMPGIGGFGVMQQLQEDAPHDYLPILVLTSDSSQALRLKALASGAQDFITKPFDKAEVKLRVRNVVHANMLHKQLQQHNATLEQKVRERTLQLKHSELKLVECLGRAAEYRDNETGQHVLRMSHMSAKLGEALGLSPQDCETLLYASPLHDVGKIGIPDTILLNPESLNAQDWSLMQQHAEIGGRLLSGMNSELLDTAAIIARTHHEHWDGSGYPNGLRGKEISLFTRIVSVCDVFDSLRSERPYKKAWPMTQVLQHIHAGSGSLFDPDIVACFKAILPQLLDIRARYPDDDTAT